jgi:hypothetical protein
MSHYFVELRFGVEGGTTYGGGDWGNCLGHGPVVLCGAIAALGMPIE